MDVWAITVALSIHTSVVEPRGTSMEGTDVINVSASMEHELQEQQQMYSDL